MEINKPCFILYHILEIFQTKMLNNKGKMYFFSFLSLKVVLRQCLDLNPSLYIQTYKAQDFKPSFQTDSKNILFELYCFLLGAHILLMVLCSVITLGVTHGSQAVPGIEPGSDAIQVYTYPLYSQAQNIFLKLSIGVYYYAICMTDSCQKLKFLDLEIVYIIQGL